MILPKELILLVSIPWRSYISHDRNLGQSNFGVQPIILMQGRPLTKMGIEDGELGAGGLLVTHLTSVATR